MWRVIRGCECGVWFGDVNAGVNSWLVCVGNVGMSPYRMRPCSIPGSIFLPNGGFPPRIMYAGIFALFGKINGKVFPLVLMVPFQSLLTDKGSPENV